jgi:hypothetical protein
MLARATRRNNAQFPIRCTRGRQPQCPHRPATCTAPHRIRTALLRPRNCASTPVQVRDTARTAFIRSPDSRTESRSAILIPAPPFCNVHLERAPWAGSAGPAPRCIVLDPRGAGRCRGATAVGGKPAAAKDCRILCPLYAFATRKDSQPGESAPPTGNAGRLPPNRAQPITSERSHRPAMLNTPPSAALMK